MVTDGAGPNRPLPLASGRAGPPPLPFPHLSAGPLAIHLPFERIAANASHALLAEFAEPARVIHYWTLARIDTTLPAVNTPCSIARWLLKWMWVAVLDRCRFQVAHR